MCENCPLYSKCMDAADVCSCVSRYAEVYHEPCKVMKSYVRKQLPSPAGDRHARPVNMGF